MKQRSIRSLLAAAGLALALVSTAHQVTAQVVKGSCEGEEACVGNTGNVAERACNGRRACAVNSGDIAINRLLQWTASLR